MSNTEEVKNVKKKKVSKKTYSNLSSSVGINLIPPKTEEEVKLETTKGTVNISAAIAVLVLVMISLIVVGYNVISKFNLNAKQETLYVLEEQLNARKSTIVANNEILRRIDLYENIQEATYSSKDVIEYWNAVSGDMADIDKIELESNLIFTVSGSAKNLTEIAKFWYLLANDIHVEEINLKSVVKSENGSRFKFEGIINFEAFK